MRLGYIVAGVVGIVVIAGIGFLALAPKSPCNQGVCKVSVTVQACQANGATASPDPVNVPAANNIEWTIETDGYLFTANGISVQGTGFTNAPGMTGNGKKFIVHDAYTDIRPNIKYSIEVHPAANATPCPKTDPLISNQ
jgi:hypothetical protein